MELESRFDAVSKPACQSAANRRRRQQPGKPFGRQFGVLATTAITAAVLAD
ncbi:hypothetical protein [uncultured Ralstonia sp.]|jgi:hypothetical protein|uniref:hypothetical protein n=1 Tax=Ralstonia sp. TaxID=54061 RepID=UPI001EA79DAB|nr:hypothetical protein [uncultured Ralstonia sp.]UCF26587.1 MAG: hypothetical protein JSV72_16550 [Ralstonia sp.]